MTDPKPAPRSTGRLIPTPRGLRVLLVLRFVASVLLIGVVLLVTSLPSMLP